MAEEGEIYWFSPEKRGIIPIDERFHIPRGLRKALNKDAYEVRRDTAFREVMAGCSERAETWIDEILSRAIASSPAWDSRIALNAGMRRACKEDFMGCGSDGRFLGNRCSVARWTPARLRWSVW